MLLAGGRPWADRAWRRVEQDPDLHAPALLDLEIAHALRGLVRGGRLAEHRARAVLREFSEDLALERHVHTPLLERVWELRDKLSAYEASYVALAEALGATLLTEDRAIARAPGIRCRVELFA